MHAEAQLLRPADDHASSHAGSSAPMISRHVSNNDVYGGQHFPGRVMRVSGSRSGWLSGVWSTCSPVACHWHMPCSGARCGGPWLPARRARPPRRPPCWSRRRRLRRCRCGRDRRLVRVSQRRFASGMVGSLKIMTSLGKACTLLAMAPSVVHQCGMPGGCVLTPGGLLFVPFTADWQTPRHSNTAAQKPMT